jgi:leucyl aminopeptidase
MQPTIEIQQTPIQDVVADAIIVNLFAGVTSPGGATGAVDEALGGAISELIAGGDLRGRAGEVAVLYPRGAIATPRVLVVGLGPSESWSLDGARMAAAAAIRRARALGARSVATIVHGAGIGGSQPEAAAQATVEGALLGHYRYIKAGWGDGRDHGDEDAAVERLIIASTLEGADLAAIERGARTGETIAGAVALARDLVNMPANEATPRYMARVARQMAADHGLDVETGGRDWAAGHDMGAFLAVAQGAGEPPRFIVLEHNRGRDGLPTIVLAGKGVTFDTGGISIKPSNGMGAMKSDMAGAAAVLGAMQVVAALDLPLHVVGLAPCTENMPDADAYRPADVITAGNGRTIEIISTDAEGRMILADALVYAQRFDPDAVIDLATLTGAAVVALGKGMAAALFSSDDGLRDRLQAAGEAAHERLWPMPLFPEYRKALQSDVADLKNSGGRMGGVGTSASFLQAFTNYPWAHLDIAGMATRDDDGGLGPKGATGFGVRLLVELLRGWQT